MQLPGRNRFQLVAPKSMDSSEKVVVSGFGVSKSLRYVEGRFLGG